MVSHSTNVRALTGIYALSKGMSLKQQAKMATGMNFFDRNAAAKALIHPLFSSGGHAGEPRKAGLEGKPHCVNNSEGRSNPLRRRKQSNGGQQNRNFMGSAGFVSGGMSRGTASRMTKKRASFVSKRRSLKSASYTAFQLADRLVDPDLLIEPERLSV